MFNIFDILQLVGGLFISLSGIPQTIQIIKTKSVKDIKLKSSGMVLIGILFMEAYMINLYSNGYGLASLITNTTSSVMTLLGFLLVFYYKYIYRGKRDE